MMDPLFQTLGEVIGRHHAWAGLALGVVTLLESLVVVGAFIPATALMVLAGGLIAGGVLDPATVIVGCVVGATAGDAISFAIGQRLGPRAFRHPLARAHRRKLARTRLYAQRYGVISIFIGRFFGPLRAFVPLVVGMLGMRGRTFQIANAASAVIWVSAVIAPGYFAARGWARFEELGEADPLTLAVLGVAAAALLGLGAWSLLRRRPAGRPLKARPLKPAVRPV